MVRVVRSLHLDHQQHRHLSFCSRRLASLHIPASPSLAARQVGHQPGRIEECTPYLDPLDILARRPLASASSSTGRSIQSVVTNASGFVLSGTGDYTQVKMDIQSLEASMRGVSLSVEAWQGNAVFVGSTTQRLQTPMTPPPPSQHRPSGTAASPISIASSPSSISSSPPPAAPLPRPRAVPHYTSHLLRTAYTPPRSRTLPFATVSPYASPSTPNRIEADKPVHPFFQRTFTRSRSSPVPPSPHKPRFVADYSSTSESQSSSQQTQGGESTFGSQESPALSRAAAAPAAVTVSRAGGCVSRTRVVIAKSSEQAQAERKANVQAEADTARGLEEITDMIGNVDLTGKFRENPLDRKLPFKTDSSDAVPGSSEVIPLVESTGAPDRQVVQKQSTMLFTKAKKSPSQSHADSSKGPTYPLGPAKTLPSKSAAAPARDDQKASCSSDATSSAFAALAADLPAAPDAIDSLTLPLFSHRTYDPAPKVVYTTDPDEANDLLSCLQGQVLGMDLEWPMAGVYDRVDPKTGKNVKVKVGMTWDEKTRRYKFGQGKVALVQLCDERMIVLVHLMHMKGLPSKVVEIMTDPKIYKTGVQIRGDGLKLVRDFPEHFPNGLTNMLELNSTARRVDPLKMGPGARLVSLANLCEQYLTQRLDKETSVRRSNWHMVLTGQQREYAANDVYASLQIHRALEQVGARHNIVLSENDLSRCSVDIDSHGKALPGLGDISGDRSSSPNAEHGAAALQRSLSAASGSAPSGYIPPKPAQLRAYEHFRTGKTISDTARESGIQPMTARTYVLGAIVALRVGVTMLTKGGAAETDEKEGDGISLQVADKERLLAEIGQGGYLPMAHRKLLRSLRAEVRLSRGESGGESESESEVLDPQQQD